MTTNHTSTEIPAYKHLTDAAAVLHELQDILVQENEAINTHDVEPVEKNLRKKNRLATKLDYLLKQIKAQRAELAEATYAQHQGAAIQAEIESLQSLSRKNMLHLKAAHEVRADTIRMIRSAFQAHTPQTETYNAAGSLEKAPSTNGLIHKAI